MKFRATLEQSKKTATGIEVPSDVLDGLNAGRRPKVRARLNGYEYRTSVGTMEGHAMLPVSAEVRAGAGLTAGDEVEVELVVDTEPRVAEVPADLAEALEAAGARAAFGKLSYSRQRRYTLSVADAKTDATRQRRITKAVEELSR
ncbi:YdeI/OmpD-associated family protein [Amycolatopsis thermoflava]|uniref:YdeI/OmpD-associated family protein n=1 Tax=Amycolatopsis thermoflava TaxID=84480 RepID=UPI003EBA4DC4